MKRRLDLAMSLIHRPQILFLDEPTTGLDPASRSAVWAEVRRLNEQFGMTIFLTTQYLEEADELADRVGIISDGLIKAEGSPTDLKRGIGADLIVAEVAGDAETAADALRAIDGIDEVQIARQRTRDRDDRRRRAHRPGRGRPRRLRRARALTDAAHTDPRRRVPPRHRIPLRRRRAPTTGTTTQEADS